MIGMVNAIGAGQAAREQHDARLPRAPSRPELGEPPMWVRPPESTTSTADTLRAVRPVKFQESGAERGIPGNDNHNETNLPGYLKSPTELVGQRLDTAG